MDMIPSAQARGSHPPRHRHTGWLWLVVLAVAGYAGWHFRPQPTVAPGGPGATAGRSAGGRGGA
ncbi:MAG: hypothetical protein ACRD1L_06310, partial [Terriglobales bacterium]